MDVFLFWNSTVKDKDNAIVSVVGEHGSGMERGYVFRSATVNKKNDI
jgi:hypothetical protein